MHQQIKIKNYENITDNSAITYYTDIHYPSRLVTNQRTNLLLGACHQWVGFALRTFYNYIHRAYNLYSIIVHLFLSSLRNRVVVITTLFFFVLPIHLHHQRQRRRMAKYFKLKYYHQPAHHTRHQQIQNKKC